MLSRLLRLAALSGGLLALARVASADPIDVVNSVRRQACGSSNGMTFVHLAPLDAAARQVAEGKSLRAAVDASGYRAVNAVLLYIDGARDENDLSRRVAQQCADIADPALQDAGSFQRGRSLWFVFAQPFLVPTLDPAVIGPRVLDLVNRARAQPRRCGSADFGAAPPLRWSPVLERVASAHARDMAERGTMTHVGRDGSMPQQRITRAGYKWSAAGENVAAGQRDAESVVRSWLSSPGHCANLMSGDYTEMAVAFATNPEGAAGIYWAQVFAAPIADVRRSPPFGYGPR
jgi:hypothetical protein